MAIVDVTRVWENALSSIDGTGTSVNGVQIVEPKGELVYEVLSDDPLDDEFSMGWSPLLPQIGETLVLNGRFLKGVFVTGYTPKFEGPQGNLYRWTFRYKLGGQWSRNEQTLNEDANKNEQKELGSFDYDVKYSDLASRFDVTGRRNVNTLGDWFSDPLLLKEATVNFKFSFQTENNPLPITQKYNDAVNSAPLWGLAPGTVRATSITASCTLLATGNRWNVNYVLSYRPNGWFERRANAGYYYLANGSPTVALNDDGSPKDAPVLLDANGGLLAANAEPYFIEFQTFQTQDLNELKLPNPFNL